MKLLVLLCLLSVVLGASISGKKAVGAKGTLVCGKAPASNVRVRLFRVKPGKKDDIGQLIDEKYTGPQGMFHVEGNTNGFPLNETDLQPVISFYHHCDDDPKKLEKTAFRRFNYILPETFVNQGEKAKKTYDLGTLNIQLEFPNEKREKTIVEKAA
ncbi:CBN-TTR-47 protein [Caenorhabditis brenneri]|uniref:CBN-TTR-47 protein n=1 Tax=Caenorhabditis brenneri TaxID=135651 RepID=G0NXB2_CAEBE|nr:CBN-TTR-47 protein [Caenorhabditis brenneri]